MSEPFAPITKPIDRGKVLSDADLAKVGEFARYKDVDGDGICYRTLPGSSHPNSAYFTRGTGHTDAATYSEKPGDWARNLDRLARKFDTARTLVPKPIVKTVPGAAFGIIAFGSSDPAVEEARSILEDEEGRKTDYLRLRALPIGAEVREFIASHRVVYVVEQNRDAQCTSILRLECPDRAAAIQSILHYNGLPIDARTIVEQILMREGESQAS
jgi:2-oxoglutarate ferredoxin oxidoreductase subunit alpha